MDHDNILDCIVVATDPPADDMVDLDGIENEADDHPAIQETQEAETDETDDETFNPNVLPQASSPEAGSDRSPKKTRTAKACRSQVRSGSMEDYDPKCGELRKTTLDTLTGIATPKSQSDLSVERPGRPQDTRRSTKRRPKDAAMTGDDPTRPRDPETASERPRKRNYHVSHDEIDGQEFGSILRSPAVSRVSLMVRGQPAKIPQDTLSPLRKHDAHQRHSPPAKARPRSKATETINSSPYTSSDEPLAVTRNRKQKAAPAPVHTHNHAGNSEDDLPIPSTGRKRRRTRWISSSGADYDKPSPQSIDGQTDIFVKDGTKPKKASDNDQQQSQAIRIIKAKLVDARKEANTYWQSFKKVQARNQDLEQQRLLWQSQELNAQDEKEALREQLEAQLRSLESTRVNSHEDIKNQVSLNLKLIDRMSKLEHKAQKDKEESDLALQRSEMKAGDLQRQVKSLQSKRLSLEAIVEEQRQQLSSKNDSETAMECQISELLSSETQLQQKVEQLETQSQSTLESSVVTRTRELSEQFNQQQTTIEQFNLRAEERQDELDWYKNQLDKERKQFQEDWDAREGEQRQLLTNIMALL